VLLTNEEVVDILDERLDYSDFGNWHGNEDDLIEFAYYVVKAEDQKRLQLAYQKDLLRDIYFSESMSAFDALCLKKGTD
jgi:energy-converting hydrogenase A subunit M